MEDYLRRLLCWALHLPPLQRKWARLLVEHRWSVMRKRYHKAWKRFLKRREHNAFKPVPILRYDNPHEKLMPNTELCPHPVIHALLKS